MNRLEHRGDWNNAGGKPNPTWARLTDDDEVRFARGEEDDLIGRIRRRIGETRVALAKTLRENRGYRN